MLKSKKVLSLLVVLALLGSMLAGMAVTGAAATNLLVNGDFEDGINGWSTHFKNGNSVAETSVIHSGNGSSAHKGNNGDPFFQTVSVTPGTTYTVTYWVKGGGVGTSVGVVEGTYSHSAALYYI